MCKKFSVLSLKGYMPTFFFGVLWSPSFWQTPESHCTRPRNSQTHKDATSAFYTQPRFLLRCLFWQGQLRDRQETWDREGKVFPLEYRQRSDLGDEPSRVFTPECVTRWNLFWPIWVILFLGGNPRRIIRNTACEVQMVFPDKMRMTHCYVTMMSWHQRTN